jgi:predicted phage tail protein
VAPTTGGALTSYQLEAGTSYGLSDLASLSTGNSETRFGSHGVPNGLYHLRVRATNTAGMSAASNELRVRVGPVPLAAPGAPSGLIAAAAGSNITLSWTAPTTGGTPSAYRIEAGSGPGQANLADVWAGGAATTFHAGGVSDGQYYLRVRATNSGGTSGPSNEAIMMVGCVAAPASPTGFAITRQNGGTVTFGWNAATGGPTTYVLEAGNATGSANLANVNLGSPATTYTAGGVGAGTYYVRIRAKNACGTSGVSNEVTLIVP